MTPCHFNLLDERWIPVVTSSGQSENLGILDVFRSSGELHCIRGESPVVTAALYRLMLAFLHRALEGPEDEDAWVDLWSETPGTKALEQLEEHGAQHRESFWLLGGDKPFYQNPGLSGVEPKPASQLLLHRAKGNNTTLFDHTVDSDQPVLPRDVAARWLVAVQLYDTGGIKTFHKKPGRKSARPGHGNLFGTVVLEGSTLWETLMLNAVIYHPAAVLPLGLGDPHDHAVWERERPPALEPDEKARARGWARLLTLPSRNVLLHSGENRGVDGVVISPGEQLDPGELDLEAMAAFRESTSRKGGFTPVRLEMLRGVWRHAADLLLPDEHGGRRIPGTLEDVRRQVSRDKLSPHKEITLRVFGQKLMSNPGAVEYWSEESLPVKLALLVAQERGWRLDPLFGRAVLLADEVGTELHRIPRTYRNELRADFDPRQHQSFLAERYWPHLDIEFARLLQDVGDLVARRNPDDPESREKLLEPFDRWGTFVRSTVEDALDTWLDHFPGGSPRQIISVARVEMIARSQLEKAFKTYVDQIRPNSREGQHRE